MSHAVPLRNAGLHVALGALAIGTVTLVCYRLHLDLTIPALLYLLILVIQSLSGGYVGTAITCLIAFGCLDYFFVPPVLTLNIDRPIDGVALTVYMATSLIITRLAVKARMDARTVESKRQDLARLYETARRLLSIEPEETSMRKTVQIFREEFDLDAVCLFHAASGRIDGCGESHGGLSEMTRQAAALGKEIESTGEKISIRLMTAGDRVLGAAGFQGLADSESVSGHLAVLAAAAIERARSFEAASAAAAEARAEALRTAIVDAFAHQFNTPLSAILTAAGGLREAGPLAAGQLELASLIESEALRLGRLTSRLLQTARLDRDQVDPRLEPTSLPSLVTHMVSQYRAEGHRVSMILPEDPALIASDRELLELALVQLLDNAFKYAVGDNPVTVRVETANDGATLRVSNQGPAISPEEHERIFDRFYRGLACRMTPGTGLGLYVARKILLAHGGRLYLEEDGRDGNITFRVDLPLLKVEKQHALKAD